MHKPNSIATDAQKDCIRTAGGVVHGDGNIFFKDIDQLLVAVSSLSANSTALQDATVDLNRPAVLNQKGNAMSQILIPPLAEGEIYLCGLVDANGDVEHTVLLPGDNNKATHEEQQAWAAGICGVLPNRIEQAVMFAKFRDRFRKEAYWSDETADWNSSCAWYQYFYDGHQDVTHKSAALRAVAVRRFKN